MVSLSKEGEVLYTLPLEKKDKGVYELFKIKYTLILPLALIKSFYIAIFKN